MNHNYANNRKPLVFLYKDIAKQLEILDDDLIVLSEYAVAFADSIPKQGGEKDDDFLAYRYYRR